MPAASEAGKTSGLSGTAPSECWGPDPLPTSATDRVPPPPPQVVLDDGMLEAAARLGLLRPDFDAGETRTHRCMRAWMHASMHAYVRNRRRRERAERVIMRAKRRGEERRGERQSDSETEIERQGDREKRGQACVCAMRYV